MKLLFIGRKGSGKTTQAKLLEQKFSFKILYIGKELRKLSLNNSALKCVLEKGLPVPKSLMKNIFGNFFKLYSNENVIVDGSPYSEEQLDIYNFFSQEIFFCFSYNIFRLKYGRFPEESFKKRKNG